MTVTELVRLGKTRILVKIDDEVAFALYGSDLALFPLKEREDITTEEIQDIYDRVLYKRAKLRLMNLLKERPFTEHELRDKLKKGYYPEAVIQVAMDYVKSFRYVDDFQFACDYIESHKETLSRRKLECKLRDKGIDEKTIRDAFDQSNAEDPLDEEAQIRALLQKRRYSEIAADPKEKAKTVNFLLRRGYSYGTVRKIMALEEEDFYLT